MLFVIVFFIYAKYLARIDSDGVVPLTFAAMAISLILDWIILAIINS